MEKAELVIAPLEGSTSNVGRCSLCKQVFPVDSKTAADPFAMQRALKDVFEAHVNEKHNWRADANQTAAFRLREMMKDWET